MRAVLDIVLIVLDLYVWLLIAAAILSWLIAFNVVNTRNQLVSAVAEFLYRITEPLLAPIRVVVKVRIRAIADGGEANRAVTELLAKALGVPKASVRMLSGATSRLKQIAVDGDPAKLGDALRKLTAAKPAE
jgi:uncharacterized protein YggU (UPF0235/DUF167 family)